MSSHPCVAFPAARSAWYPRSPRLQAVRPSTNGAYSFRGLPPGDYLIAALTDVEPDEWHDASFLEQLVASAVKVTLAEGERKVQDLRIAR
jgi:hypothetical protein